MDLQAQGLGVYQNYNRPADTQEFGTKNLIYGWNYSGKTTLSRLFAQLESKTANPDLFGCEFSFGTDNDAITEKNFTQRNISVRVFNSDFIKANLHFDGESFNPILLLGKESEKAQQKIDKLGARIKRSFLVQRKLNGEVETLKSRIAQAKTDAAKFIRQRLKVDPYTATHLGQDVQVVSILDSQLLMEKELSNAIELALTPDSKRPSTVDELHGSPAIEELHKEAVTVLAATPSFSNTLKHLEENPAIERWVQSGLHLHPTSGTCEFCGNDLSPARLEALRTHFSKDLADHQEKVDGLLERVKTAEFRLTWPKTAELNPQFRDSYNLAIEVLPAVINTLNQAVKKLAGEVQLKADDSRKAMNPSPLAPGLEVAIKDAVAAVNAIIKQNNELASNFTNARADALRKAKYHYVQQFIDEQDAAGLEVNKDQQAKRYDRLKAYVSRLQPEIERLQADISQAQQGREKINERLVSMLGSEAVQIKVVKDPAGQDRFQMIRRDGAAAKNLSDGERTAIAFSYFLTKLQEIKPAEFKETIVYIDDPISSLDANHIFQVTAAIRALFFTQQNKGEPWQTTCKQIFVSTHNFEFFSLLREIKPTDTKKGARLYLIRRIADKSSTLENMPASLARYQSEYHFLFEVIHRFNQAPDKTAHDVLMLLPNAMRRFIELYTYSRLPGPKDAEQVDERAEVLFGVERAKRILKIFHYFSHGNTLDRLAGNNELIFDLEHAVRDLIDAITETDKPHMDALITATQA
ncbi:AAA family ATPase [Aeromonas caviae]|uniref:AAA family ATPase n=1 Tax=Aeromonas caviae TaxID=648 RepID=UPI002B255BFF|nr:AAA family ATPase [Aeromonas caviae]MEA9428663.1 AAA family ATPase [Aeromonas caviae]MEA9433255.1 AAA family ATPase [Aeromonas caviae]